MLLAHNYDVDDLLCRVSGDVAIIPHKVMIKSC